VAHDAATVKTIRQRWKSGEHVGVAKPTMRGYVRSVVLGRELHRVPQDDIYAHIPNWQGGNKIWQGRWYPKSDWVALPNVLSVEGDQDFNQNGVGNCVIEIDNVAMIEQSGVAGVYHLIERGYYSPFRGTDPRGGLPPIAAQNEWYDVLSDKSTQIIIVAGYGDAAIPIFEGLVNDIDMTSRPDRITLTCRDGGQVVTDQRVFLNAKVRYVKDPITFADRRDADETERKGYGAEAKNRVPWHPPRFVLDDKDSTSWVSGDYNVRSPNELPWLQIALPHGRYESFRFKPRFPDLTGYVAIKAKDKNAPGKHGARKHFYNTKYKDGEWIDEGLGTVPGTNIPYVKKIDDIKGKGTQYGLPDYGYDLGDDSKIRIYFDNLDRGRAYRSPGRAFHAGAVEFKGIRRRLTAEARKNKWILVDDLADVVRTVFQWSGINEWDVETTGVRLREKSTWNRGNFLIDIINAASDQVGYAFHMRPRENFDEGTLTSPEEEMSMGIAVWRQTNAMRSGGGVRDAVEMVHEEQTLQGINAKITDEPLAYNIRVRGRAIKRKKGGRVLGGDDTLRWMYVYRPPWSRGEWRGHESNDYRNANIKKYVVHHDNSLKTLAQCKVAALFIAFREAMESAQVQFEAPCMPTMYLDQHCGLFDTGTGLSTRVYIASRQYSYRSGENGHFKMALAGSLLDTQDIVIVRDELTQLLKDNGYDPGISRGQLRRWGRPFWRNN